MPLSMGHPHSGSYVPDLRMCMTDCFCMQDGAAVAAPLQIEGTSWPMTCVSMGNPHAVTFGPADSPIQVDSLPLAQLGPHFETHPAFPAKTNTEFVEVLILIPLVQAPLKRRCSCCMKRHLPAAQTRSFWGMSCQPRSCSSNQPAFPAKTHAWSGECSEQLLTSAS